MYNYLIISLPFLVVAAVLMFKIYKIDKSTLAKVVIASLIMTAVFDSAIIAMGFVGYDTSKLLGIYVFKAPLEDFFYIIFALAVTIYTWEKLNARDS